MCKQGASSLLKVVVVMLGLVLSEVQAEDIGAWFPVGGINPDSTKLNDIFDSVVEANFNVVHGPLIGDTEKSNGGFGDSLALQPKDRVKAFLKTAKAKGLKVQLYSWDLPPNLWNEKKKMLSYPLDVLSGRFQRAESDEKYEYEVDLVERAIVARTKDSNPAEEQDSGYMLTTRGGLTVLSK